MLNFCKRVFFHYFFSHTDDGNEDDDDRRRRHRRMRIQPVDEHGLAVIFMEMKKLDNVLESCRVKPPCKKRVVDSGGGYCFLDEIMNSGGGGSCTESLGFESSDQMEEEEDDEIVEGSRSKSVVRTKWSADDEVIKVVRKRRTNFPPPLSSLNQNGQPSFFLKPVRKNGRLELTEFRINRPVEFLRASRQDGRLRLHLVVSQPIPEICQQQEEQEQEEETEQVEVEEQEQEEPEHEPEEEEIRESVQKFPLTSGGSRDGFRRCQEIRNRHHHHHHHLPIWKQHQVTITRSTVHVL